MNGEAMKPRLSFEWLHACSGCEISLLNIGDGLLDLLQRFDIVHFPLLMDSKHLDNRAGDKTLRLPEADIGFVSGGVAHAEHLAVLQEMRRTCRVLIGLGTCATHGGIPAMINEWPMEQSLETVFTGLGAGPVPDEVPPLFDRVYSVDEQVEVDVSLAGCPPRPELIIETIEAQVRREEQRTPRKSVCEMCPTIREGVLQTKTIRRFVDNADYDPNQPVGAMRCLLEQGLLCMGPVTAGGCGGKGAPLCLNARVPCRGCYGPVRQGGNQLLDMMNGLAGKGVDHRSLVDRRSLLRFSGGHGLLKPIRKR